MESDEMNGHGLVKKAEHKVSVMLVDDDQPFLQSVVASLQRHHHDQLDIVGTAKSSEECFVQAQMLSPEVVLIDLNMPGRRGLWTIPLLHSIYPDTRVIVLTHNDDADSRQAVLEAGGTDLVSKAAWKTDLIPAIQRAVNMRDTGSSLAVESSS